MTGDGSASSSGGSGGGSGSDSGSSSGSSSSSGSGSSSGSSGDSGAADSSLADAGGDGGAISYSLSFPAMAISPGDEQTNCIVVHLGNPAPIHVGTIHDIVQPGGMQLSVYASTATTEQPTPAPCVPMAPLNSGSAAPLIFSRVADDTLSLPQGVGYTLGANQMVLVELHVINTTAASLAVGATTTLVPMNDAAFQNEAAMLLAFNTQFTIPAQGANVSANLFQPIPSRLGAAQVAALSGFENHLGTEMQVWNATNSTDTSMRIYDGLLNLGNPRVSFAPPQTFASGAGLAFQCTWTNFGSSTVTFGTSYANEVCMVVAHYFPSQGTEVCLNGTCSP
jgi:hypothetical protein